MNVLTNTTGANETVTAWVQKDGTVVAVDFSGQNLTGTQAGGIFSGLMFAFTLDLQYNNYIGPFTTAAGVHQVGTGTVTITGTTLSVTNYAASSLPLSLTACGSTFTLTEFSMQTGTIQGGQVTLITQFHLKGTSQVGGGTAQTGDFTLSVVAVTKA